MDKLFNMSIHFREIYTYGREIVDKLVISIYKIKQLRMNQLLTPGKIKDYTESKSGLFMV